MKNFDWGKYEERMDKLMASHKVPGAAVSVALEGKPVYTKGFGWRNVESQLPIDENTVFGIGSVTKSFTAVAIMQLQDQGKLSVEDPVVKYLPDFKINKNGAEQGMTIHHFLTHTAGIPPLVSLMRTLARSMKEDPKMLEGKQGEQLSKLEPIDTEEELIKFIAEQDIKLLGNPGEHFSYSNDCYALLGAIIHRVSGLPYEEYVTKHILQPLGMTRSTFSAKEVQSMDNVAALYTSEKVKRKDHISSSPYWWEAPAMSAAGFLKSTTRDMLRYMEIFRTDGTCDGVRILSPESVDQICTPYAQPVPGQFYGYGMMVHSNYKGVSLVEHGGNIKGVSAWVSCIREKGITGVTLTNLVSSPGAEIMLGAINTALNVPVKTRRYNFKPFYCPPEKLAQYEGVYISGEGATVKVTAKGNNLQFEMGGARFTGRPIGVDTFSMRRKGLDSAVRFLRNTKGDTWGIAAGFRIIPKAPPAPTEMSAT